ncbi:TetR-like C-terminal domain-containing protein [Streptomyces sp. NBC_00872]|uniref:TetR-like C-terminal domain-containing protein n=1 Tax=Streptomyces sp. NBC_00872 TaxID=2903686 RepID=UPI003866B254|nr:TetR family transcriptional regulator C-terminal domain-containing protein [Streptomyces sp. NBC_00872]
MHVSRGPAEAVPPTHADDPAVIPHDPAAAFVAGALLGIVLDWLHHDCPGTPEQLGATVWPQLLAGTAAAGVPGGLDPDRRTGTAPTPVV